MAFDSRPFVLQALTCLRVLSRDKDHLAPLTSTETVALLVEHAQLSEQKSLSMAADVEVSSPKEDTYSVEAFDVPVVIESEKVLHNLLILSPEVRQELCSLHCVNSLMSRLRSVRDNGGHDDRQLPYDLIVSFVYICVHS